MEYLKIIIESNIFSGFLGLIVGGVITWVITKNSLNEQFKYQKELAKSEQKKREKIGLQSIKSEIIYNLMYLNSHKQLFNEANVTYINFKKSDSNIMLKKNNWERHSDIIESIKNLELVGNLKDFYLNISSEVMCQATNLDRTTKLIKQSNELLKSLEDEIKLYE